MLLPGAAHRLPYLVGAAHRFHLASLLEVHATAGDETGRETAHVHAAHHQLARAIPVEAGRDSQYWTRVAASAQCLSCV